MTVASGNRAMAWRASKRGKKIIEPPFSKLQWQATNSPWV